MDTVMEVIGRLTAYKEKIVQSTASGNDLDPVMESMFAYFSEVSNDAVVNALEQHPEYDSLRSFLSHYWLQNFYIKEVNQGNSILSGKEPYGLQTTNYQYLINFDPEIMELIDSYAPRRQDYELVMAGCGPYPETLIRMYMSPICRMNRFNGLDNQHVAITIAQELCDRFVTQMPNKNLYFTHTHSEIYDYSTSGVIILANSLSKKRSTLERAIATMPHDAAIIVRNPMRLGKLIQDDIFKEGPLPENIIMKEFVPIGIKSSIYVFKRNY